MKKKSIILLSFALALVGATAFLAGSSKISIFIDLPSLAVTLVLSLAMLFSHFSWKEISAAYKNSLEKRAATENEIRVSVLVFESFQKYLIYSAVLAFLIGLVCIFSSFKNMEEMGRGLAVCILSALYSAVIIFFAVIPFKYALLKKQF